MTRTALLALIAASLAGCSRGKPGETAEEIARAATKKAEAERRLDEQRSNIATSEGRADRRDLERNRRLYTIAWKSAAVTLGRAGGLQEGKMNAVDGIVYDTDTKGAERAKSTFTARTGYAKKDTQTLYLEDEVVVRSPAYKTTLRAEKLEWLPDVKRYKATGSVTVEGPWGLIGPTSVLLATSDLKRVGAPEAFDSR